MLLGKPQMLKKSEINNVLACVASVSVQFGSKELQGDEWSE